MEEIKDLLGKGRMRAWLRFNTINRGDAVKILDNLSNILNHRQTTIHEKLKVNCCYVCPGPSLSKTSIIKELKGKRS